MTISDAAATDLRARLRPPRHPLAMFVWPTAWLSVAYCAASIVVGLLALVAGILGLLVIPYVTWATANLERLRLGSLGLPTLTPLPPFRGRRLWDTGGFGEGNLAVWALTVLFGLVDLIPGGVLVILVIGLGVTLVRVIGAGGPGIEIALAGGALFVVLLVGLYVAWALAAAQAILVDMQLRRPSELSHRVDELTVSRRELVDVFSAERRRIERDLHDGAQQHLVLLSMHLGEADYALGQGHVDEARTALGAAQESVESAMTALRETVRGIHPQILLDRGLAAAVTELAGRQPLPIRVDVAGVHEPGQEQALAAYYLVSEALTNIAKHARASSASVSLTLADPLIVQVTDDGVGGAVVRPGHGLSGLFERARALGGECWLSSPPGGPTVLRGVLPGRASS